MVTCRTIFPFGEIRKSTALPLVAAGTSTCTGPRVHALTGLPKNSDNEPQGGRSDFESSHTLTSLCCFENPR
jgi:hypothetical protein